MASSPDLMAASTHAAVNGGPLQELPHPLPTKQLPSSPPTPPPPPAAQHATTKAAPRRVPHTPQMVVKVRDCPSSQMPIELCYQCFGDPAAGLPPVLLICGLNMQMYAWDEAFCESLVRAGFFVIRYDNRDMGHSTKVEHRGRVKAPLLLLPGSAATWLGEKLPYSVEDMAADVWALLDVLGLPCAHLFGISMGGMIAQTAALQAPARTISLTSVMSSTNAPDLPQPQLWVKLWMLRKPPRNCTVEELLEFRVHSLRRLLRSALPPDSDYLKKRFLMSLKRSSYSAGLVRQAATIRRAVGRDAALQRLAVPALVVHGAQDVVVPPIHGYRTATMLPFARLLVLKSMGHYFHPAFFSTIIEAFADMAASTDVAKRGLGSRLPSANALLDVSASARAKARDVHCGGGSGAEDGNAAAATAWRRGGGSVSASHADAAKSCGSGEWASGSTPPRTGAARSTPPPPARPSRENERHNSPLEKKEEKAAEREEEEEEGGEEDVEVSLVDAHPRTMASMSDYIQPVVADAASPVGSAACRSVMVAVPGGSSNPAVPEAVIVENLFLRGTVGIPPSSSSATQPSFSPGRATEKRLGADTASPTTSSPAPSSATTTLANAGKRSPHNSSSIGSSGGAGDAGGGSGRAGVPSTLPPPSSATSSLGRYGGSSSSNTTAAASTTSAAASPTASRVIYSPLATHVPPPPGTAVKAATAAEGRTTSATVQKPLVPMEGGVPYVPRSPSRWHEAAPFPLRSAAAAASPTTSTTTTIADTTYPRFHPTVVGIPVNAYLDTHPMERESSGFLIATRTLNSSMHGRESGEASLRAGATGSATTLPEQQPRQQTHRRGSATEASWTSATVLADASPGLLCAVTTATVSGDEAVVASVSVSGSGVARSPPSRSSSQERRENESFLQLQAPEEVVEATALPSL